MAVNVRVYSLKEFTETAEFTDDNVEQFPLDYFICINASGFIHSTPYFKKDHATVLNLYFDDVDRDHTKFDIVFNMSFPAKACTVEQAESIVSFVNSIPDGATVHIYCTKGKSRSPAVAMYVEEVKNNNTIKFDTYNEYVFNLLKSYDKF